MTREPRPRSRTRFSIRWPILGLISLSWLAISVQANAQDNPIETPTFRARTDDAALRDLDAVRERLKRVTDSRGPVNPLGDYVRPRVEAQDPLPKPIEPAKKRVADDEEDSEAARVPSLNAEAQRRLKAQPPTVSPTEMSIIGLYPPPQITSNTARPNLDGWVDDGFRPSSFVTTATWASPTQAMEGAVSIPVVSEGWPVTANYMQNDPAAMIPPSLGNPPFGNPSVSSPAFGLPSSLPPANSSIPSFGPPPSNLGAAPSAIMPGQGPYIMPGQGAAVMPGQGTVMPAPPSYVVPAPNPFASPGNPSGGAIMPPGSGAVPGRAGSTMPYSDVMPIYSRSGTFVNNAPFVSAPPQAKDARWMVSPEVYRRASGEACGPAGTGFPIAGVPAGTSSPFTYAPPVWMPTQTASTSWHNSLLHPFRSAARHFHR